MIGEGLIVALGVAGIIGVAEVEATELVVIADGAEEGILVEMAFNFVEAVEVGIMEVDDDDAEIVVGASVELMGVKLAIDGDDDEVEVISNVNAEERKGVEEAVAVRARVSTRY
jgi:molybdenum cofactor biosynthesis enzyme